MNLIRTRTITTALACSLALVTGVAVPEAHAGIWGFLKQHLLGGHASKQHKKKVAYYHRKFHWGSTDSTTAGAAHSGEVAADQGAASEGRVSSGRLIRGVAGNRLSNRLKITDPAQDALIEPQSIWRTTQADRPQSQWPYNQQAKGKDDHAFSTRASWYGPGFDGKRTASGERFDQYGLTAASRTLPLGSKVLVANPTTGKCCTVTINDRGPYVTGRDIDLSRGAAGKIGVTGVSPVVCVAYANNAEASAPSNLSVGQSVHNGTASFTLAQQFATDQGHAAKISGKVMRT